MGVRMGLLTAVLVLCAVCGCVGEASVELVKQVSADAFPPRFGGRMVRHSGSLFLIGGRKDLTDLVSNTTDGFLNDVWRSDDDGATWKELVRSGPFSPRGGFGLLSFAGLMWMLGGHGVFFDIPFPYCLSATLVSSDGIHWNVTSGPGVPVWYRHSFGATVWKDRMWVVGGNQCPHKVESMPFTDVWVSGPESDGPEAGREWQQVGYAFPLGLRRQGLVLVGYGDRLFAMGGGRQVSADPSFGLAINNDVFYSHDGITWVQLPTPAWSRRWYLGATVLATGQLFVFGGRTLSYGPVVMADADMVNPADAGSGGTDDDSPVLPCEAGDVWMLPSPTSTVWEPVTSAQLPALARYDFAYAVSPTNGSIIIAAGASSSSSTTSTTPPDDPSTACMTVSLLADVAVTTAAFPCSLSDVECSGRGTCSASNFTCACSGGYTGQHCSSCAPGHHPVDGQCVACPTGFTASAASVSTCDVCAPGWTADRWDSCTQCHSHSYSATVVLVSVSVTAALTAAIVWMMHTQLLAILAVSLPVLQLMALAVTSLPAQSPTFTVGPRQLLQGFLVSVQGVISLDFLRQPELWGCGGKQLLGFEWLWGAPLVIPCVMGLLLLFGWCVAQRCFPAPMMNRSVEYSPDVGGGAGGVMGSPGPIVQYTSSEPCICWCCCCCRRRPSPKSTATLCEVLFPTSCFRTVDRSALCDGLPMDPSLDECASSAGVFYQHLLRSFLAYLLLCYVPICSISLSALPCKHPDRPGLKCDRDVDEVLRGVSSLLVLVVSVLLPFALSRILRAHQNGIRLNAAGVWRRYGILYQLFLPHHSTWILLYFPRWVAETALLRIGMSVDHHTHTLVVMLVICIELLWLVVQFWTRPFRVEWHAYVDYILGACFIVLLASCLALRLSSQDESIAAGVGIGSFGVAIVVTLAAMGFEWRRLVKAYRSKQPVFRRDALLFMGDDEWHDSNRSPSPQLKKKGSSRALHAPLLFLDDDDDGDPTYFDVASRTSGMSRVSSEASLLERAVRSSPSLRSPPLRTSRPPTGRPKPPSRLSLDNDGNNKS